MKKIIILLIALSLLGSTFLIDSTNSNKPLVKNLESDKCSGMDLFKTSECLHDDLDLFYKYNISNVDKNLSLDELKEIGGVCWHYADYIVNRLISLGAKYNKCGENLYQEKDSFELYVTKCQMQSNNESSHVVAIVSNDDGWCMFSNNNLNCWSFVK